ncbi:snRNA-activating protein complex subunit 1 [Anopheles marshallii]|uniref:snRNA-activating protein complex subunit 1 n=1 Tax=Anopheles marshallii TaxID=1521116 RepID=UPI00237AD1C0|nr:snRNA-activating protein complex subunit 1 [Anopheles marshallii]
MASVISSGFREDCADFLGEFAKLKAPDYQSFCQEWKRTNFQYIFYGRNTDAEMAEYLGEIFYTVKKCFFASKNQFERIAAFYLLYTLYFKQPLFMFCKIRLTLTEWRVMKDFARHPYNGQKLPQVTVILWKLFKSDAFRFVHEELERGFDRFYLKSSGTSFDSSGPLRTSKDLEKELLSLTTPGELINAMEILEMAYNEMKEALDDNGASATESIVGDKIPQSTLMESLRSDIDSLGSMLRSNENQTAIRSNLNLTEEDTDSVGAKRYSLRRKAYKREVKKKVFRIAGRECPNSSEESDDKNSSGVAEKCANIEQVESKRGGFRSLHHKASKLR